MSGYQWLSLLLSLGAVVVSSVALVVSHSSRKEERFLECFSLLLTPEAQQGRKLLFEFAEKKVRWSSIRTKKPLEWSLINRSLALMEYVAAIRARGALPRARWRREDPLLQLWFKAFSDIAPHARSFIAYRMEREGWPSEGPARLWPHLESLLDEAIARRKKVDPSYRA